MFAAIAGRGSAIISITNGIHVPGWTAGEMRHFQQQISGSRWEEHHDDPVLWERLADVPDEELWRVHVALKDKLMTFCAREHGVRGWMGSVIRPRFWSAGRFGSDALTIGFARRFATYKAGLALVHGHGPAGASAGHAPAGADHFAGKAHPADEPGKHLIQQVYTMAKSNRFGGRVAFVEDYDMHSALLQTRCRRLAQHAAALRARPAAPVA